MIVVEKIYLNGKICDELLQKVCNVKINIWFNCRFQHGFNMQLLFI